MTTEDDFNRMLDANPDDHVTRLVFADWLQERGDPRAEGYRALGRLRLRPEIVGSDVYWARWGSAEVPMPDDWFFALPECKDIAFTWPQSDDRHSRREAEDAAALAFAKLPADRRAELLNVGAAT